MYRRNGTAKAIVNIPPNITWMDDPEIEASESFLKDWEFLKEERDLISRLKGLDKRQRVGIYAGLLIEIKDGKQLNEPVDSVSSVEQIVSFKPVYEAQLTVSELNEDGSPAMYNFNSAAFGNRDNKASRSATVHPDRIVISAEDADDGSIHGVPALEACFNSLMDLVKIGGASGEGYYQNTRQAPIIKAGKDAKIPIDDTALKIWEEDLTSYLNDWRKFWISDGLDLEFPDINLSDPKEHRQTAINDCSAASEIPNTMLNGTQTGVLAGIKDFTFFLMGQNSRRKRFGTKTVKDVLKRLIKYKALPNEKFKVTWNDLLTLSDLEKAELAVKMSTANKNQFDSAQPVIYPVENIQESVGVEVEFVEMPTEIDNADTET